MPGKTPLVPKVTWRAAPKELVGTFEKAIRWLPPEAEPRRMFGYPCAFVHGQMFAGLHQEVMILRLSAEQRRQFLELPGARPFEPMAGKVMREYVVVPQAMLAADEDLCIWLERAFQYANSLPPKEARKTRARTATNKT